MSGSKAQPIFGENAIYSYDQASYLWVNMRSIEERLVTKIKSTVIIPKVFSKVNNVASFPVIY